MQKPTKKLTKKKLDTEISAMFNKHGNRRQFNTMDLGKISGAGRAAYEAAATHEDGLAAADRAIAAACDALEVRKERKEPKVDPCLAAALADADADAAEGVEEPGGDFDFRIPGLT